ncbi:MAG: Uncharacterised protein [Opitutia bacterium UBA7350]|nr:MAG: Uncharacterised protein [Opitutae bacterium UBA7350]
MNLKYIYCKRSPLYRITCALTFLALALCPLSKSQAELRLNPLFCDHAVLQRGIPISIWGTADEGEVIEVTFRKHQTSTTTRNGKWHLQLPAMPAGGPDTMTIQGENIIRLKDLMVGEVWICSGQSNMERQLGLRAGQQPIDHYLAEAARATYPKIREFQVARANSDTRLSEVSGEWKVCNPESVLDFSAVGYFFASELFQAIDVPIGIIHATWGGTPVQAWTSYEIQKRFFPKTLEKQLKEIQTYPARLTAYQASEPDLMAGWQEAYRAAEEAGKKKPKPPRPPVNPATSKNRPTGLFNGMIHPIIPYGIKGVIWYQGESNSGIPEALSYNQRFSAMIDSWRAEWGLGNFPFLFVQIAPHNWMNPEIREAQFQTLQTVSNTAMAVTTDVGDPGDIHPTNKRPVGERLALAARALAYDEAITYSGPLYKSMQLEGREAILTFTHCGSGLLAKDGPLRGFTLSGDGKSFVKAHARIEGNTVVISSNNVAKPIAVRYGWKKIPEVNLYNREGLPASPFRTDAPPIKLYRASK